MAFCSSLSAQDIILTKDSDMIEADVQEISDDFVTYKAFNNQDGPIYRIATSKVVKIKFKNGTEQTFNKQASPYVARPATISGTEIPSGQLAYRNGALYCGGTKLTETDLQSLLPVDLYKQANGGLNMRKHGKRLVMAGSILSALGTATTITLYYSVYVDQDYSWEGTTGAGFYLLGIAATGAGFTCLAAGIPLYCVGQYRAKKAASSYNMANGYPELSFNIGSTRNGFGVFMTF